MLLGIMGSRAWRITTPFRRTIPSRYLSNGRDYLNSFDLVIDQIRNHGEMEMLGSCVAGALWEGDVVLLKGSEILTFDQSEVLFAFSLSP